MLAMGMQCHDCRMMPAAAIGTVISESVLSFSSRLPSARGALMVLLHPCLMTQMARALSA